MQRHGGTRFTAATALLLTAVLVAACASQPVSQAVESDVPDEVLPSSIAGPSPTGSPGVVDPPSPEATPARASSNPAGGSRIPDKPTAVTWEEVAAEPLGGGDRVTHRLTWSAPDGVATRFTVVGVTACLREGRRFDGKPCLVRGMRIPKAVQEVLATIPGTERSAEISWTAPETGPGPYAAVLVRASNDAGDSIFTIAWSETVCWRCTD